METVFYTLIILFSKHLLADFFLQPQEMAIAKKNSLAILTIHCLVHWVATTAILLAINWLWFPISAKLLVLVPVLDAGSHWLIDFVTSRMNKVRGWTPEHRPFWLNMGIDQYAHYIIYIVISSILV